MVFPGILFLLLFCCASLPMRVVDRLGQPLRVAGVWLCSDVRSGWPKSDTVWWCRSGPTAAPWKNPEASKTQSRHWRWQTVSGDLPDRLKFFAELRFCRPSR
jgi:hypothetical protein